MSALSIPRVSPCRSYIFRIPFMALGENLIARQLRYASTASSKWCSRSASSPRISHSVAVFL